MRFFLWIKVSLRQNIRRHSSHVIISSIEKNDRQKNKFIVTIDAHRQVTGFLT